MSQHHRLLRSLPVADRLTMVPLFAALLDYDSSPEVYERYDRMSARELFRQYGVSQRRAAACLSESALLRVL